MFSAQLGWRRRALCAWSLGKAAHILALNSSSDLIVSESIRERQHLAMESGEVSHAVPHQPCITARDSEVSVQIKVWAFSRVNVYLGCADSQSLDLRYSLLSLRFLATHLSFMDVTFM